MVRIAVADDEKQLREVLIGLVKRFCPDSLAEGFASGGELLAADGDFDIVFLDIQMDGKNGIDTARALRNSGFAGVVIFVTGFKEYVFEAFDVSAFHYLLKPVEEKRFAQVFGQALAKVRQRRKREEETLLIKTGSTSVVLKKERILYLENRTKRVEIHAGDGIYEIYAAMSKLEHALGEDFYRCHRGYLVNMAHIAEYTNDSITLSNKETIFLAKERYKEFVKAYLRYLRKEGGTDV